MRRLRIRRVPPSQLLVQLLALTLAAGPAVAVCSTIGLPEGRLVAELQTSVGQVCIELLDDVDEAPGHVENFLWYLDNGHLTDSFFHRAVDGFIVQGASYLWDGSQFDSVPTRGVTVINEPCTIDFELVPADDPKPAINVCSERGNEAYTVALAKRGGAPNSGSASWFFNLSDNRANLDNQNGGFTVFGRVTDVASRQAIDRMAAANAPMPSFEEFFWIGSQSQGLLAFENPQSGDYLPLTGVLPPMEGDGESCLDMTELATVFQPNLNDLLFELNDPDDVPPFYYTVPASCGTPVVAFEEWVPGPGSVDCPEPDRIALRTINPSAQTGDIPIIPDVPEYVSYTCEQLDEATIERNLWQIEMKDALLDNLVFIDDAVVRVAVPEPSAGLAAATSLLTLALLRRRAGRRAGRREERCEGRR